MSANDGGDPIRLSKAPVEKPEIVRGRMVVWPELLDGPAEVGGVVGFTIKRGAFQITTHACRVVAVRENLIHLDVGPDTVVTWDRVPGASAQI